MTALAYKKLYVPGRQAMYIGQAKTGQFDTPVKAQKETIDGWSRTPNVQRVEFTPKLGYAVGVTSREAVARSVTLTETAPAHLSGGLLPFSVFGLLGAAEIGSSDTVSGGPLYTHTGVRGLLGTRLNTCGIWHKLGNGTTEYFAGATPSQLRLTWSQQVYLAVETTFQARWGVTSDDDGFPALPSGTTNLSEYGTQGVSGQISRTRTKGAQTRYAIYAPDGSTYSSHMFDSGDATIGCSVNPVWGKSGGSYISTIQPTPNAPVASGAATGALVTTGYYTYWVATLTTEGFLTPLSPASNQVHLTGTNKTIGLTFDDPAVVTGHGNAAYTLIYRTLNGLQADTTAGYLDKVAAGVTTYTDAGAIAAGSTVPPEGFAQLEMDCDDFEPGELTVTGSIMARFQGAGPNSPYRTFIDLESVGEGGGSRHVIQWIDDDGQSLELTLGVMEFDTAAFDESANGLRLNISFTAHADELALMDASSPTANAILAAKLRNYSATSLIY